METDIKEEPWFSTGFPAFNHCGWQKTPFFWSNNNQKIPSHSTPFSSTPSGFTANEAMFGYTQPGFIPTRHSVVGPGANNLYNNFAALVHPSNWFETKSPHFGNGDSQTTFGTSIRFQPTFGAETAVNNTSVKVRYQTITIMPQYLHKSFEELRLEDYVANRHRTNQVHSTQFARSDFVQNEVPFFDALLQNSNNAFRNQFFSSEGANSRSNISDNATNKYTEPSPLTNPNFLLEYLLNHVKNRLNLQLISDKTRYTCEKLTTKLAEYTEKTLETLTVVVLEDILTTIKGRNQVTAPSTSFVASKVGENEQLSEAGSNRKSKTKSTQHGARKVDSRIIADTNSSCPRSTQPPKKEIAFESDDACSDASSAAEDWCCASKHQAAAKKQRDRPACAECQCEARKKPSSRCAASAAVVAGGGGHSRTSGTRKSSQGDCCAKEISVRRMCGSKCAKSKWTPSKSTSRRCQMAKRITHRCYDDEPYIRQRLRNVRVDTDDGEGDKAADAPHKEKPTARCKAALDDFHATGGATIGATGGDEEKDTQPPVTTDARSNDGTDESDFSSV